MAQQLLKTKSEQKAWLLKNWAWLVHTKKLSEALKRYYGVKKKQFDQAEFFESIMNK